MKIDSISIDVEEVNSYVNETIFEDELDASTYSDEWLTNGYHKRIFKKIKKIQSLWEKSKKCTLEYIEKLEQLPQPENNINEPVNEINSTDNKPNTEFQTITNDIVIPTVITDIPPDLVEYKEVIEDEPIQEESDNQDSVEILQEPINDKKEEKKEDILMKYISTLNVENFDLSGKSQSNERDDLLKIIRYIEKLKEKDKKEMLKDFQEFLKETKPECNDQITIFMKMYLENIMKEKNIGLQEMYNNSEILNDIIKSLENEKIRILKLLEF